LVDDDDDDDLVVVVFPVVIPVVPAPADAAVVDAGLSK
jgi:hypothetical protein